MHGRCLIVSALFVPLVAVSAKVRKAAAGAPARDSMIAANVKSADPSADVFEAQWQAYAEQKGRFYTMKRAAERPDKLLKTEPASIRGGGCQWPSPIIAGINVCR